jgi:hypothetical protein
MRTNRWKRISIWLAWCFLGAIPAAFAQSHTPSNPRVTADACYTTITSPVSKATVLNSIHIKTAADIRTIRSELISQIWGATGLPTTGLPPTNIVQTTPQNAASNASGLYSLLTNLGHEQRLNVNLRTSPSINSIVYEWIPKVSNRRLFILHDGHSDDAYNADGTLWASGINNSTNLATANTLLGLGFTVLWIQMPLYGDNLRSSPGVSFSNCPVTSNDWLNFSKCDRHQGILNAFANPLRYFIEPVIIAINTVLAQRPFTDITMMGASGGGWTTVLSAAVDPRIRTSTSVAGSLPLFLPSATDACQFSRDAEQLDQPGLLYKSISYLDLYILAANGSKPNGSNRRHLQINNQFDSCCFFGINFRSYESVLGSYISANRLGNYAYHLDTTFVGHGYDVTGPEGPKPVNNTLTFVLHVPGR